MIKCRVSSQIKHKEDTLSNKYSLAGSLSGSADFIIVSFASKIAEFLIKSRMNPVISKLSQVQKGQTSSKNIYTFHLFHLSFSLSALKLDLHNYTRT